MKIKPKYLPLLALGFGIIGLLLRRWLFSGGLDAKNLIIPDHPANILSFVVLALDFGVFFLALQLLTGKPAYRRLFPKSPLALCGSLAGSICLLMSVLSNSAYTSILLVLGVAAALGMALGGLLRFGGKRPHVLCHGMIALYLILHLIFQYKQWSAEPELQEYFFPLLACIFVMLTAYHRTTLDHLYGSRKWFVFFNYSSVVLCITALDSEMWLLYLSFALWCLTCDCSLTPEQEMVLPKNVQICMNKLKDAGFEAYVVGGCVRDSLLGLTPTDYDMCTDAKPEEIAKVFQKHELVRNGEKHGTIGVILDKEVFEITTFRTEGSYSDSRHPDYVEFVTSLAEDLARRDFTVNAMAYSPETGYIDLFGGRKDLQQGLLRTVGKPEQRFKEDALRVLRGVRFAVRFDLMPETNTLQAMTELASEMNKLAKERVYAELSKLLPTINAQQLLLFAPVITQVIPELKTAVGFDQHSPHHAYDVYTHTAHVVEALPADLTLRFAGLLHDIAKPQVFTQGADGRGHFYGHAQAGAATADAILLRLKAPTQLRQEVVTLIENHMLDLTDDKKLLKKRLARFGDQMLQKILTLQEADFFSKGVGEDPIAFDRIRDALKEILAEANCLCVKDLAIDGKDLMELGIAPGPQMGEILDRLLEMVLDETLQNEKAALLQTAKNLGGLQ